MSKFITIMRHGQAQYALTAAGREQVEDVALQLAATGRVANIILHSPIKRTAETAHIVHQVFAKASHRNILLKEWRALHCDEDITIEHIKAIDLDSVAPDSPEILLVTHQPNIISLSKAFGREAVVANAEALSFEFSGINLRDLHPLSLEFCEQYFPKNLTY